MKRFYALALLLAAFAPIAAAQPADPYEQLQIRFAGTLGGLSVYSVSFFVNPVENTKLEVVLDDTFPHSILPKCDCSWEFEGTIESRTFVSVDFVSGFWFLGPAILRAKRDDVVLQSIEDIHLQTDVVSGYGTIDTDRNRLSLYMPIEARIGSPILVRGAGAVPEGLTVIAAAPTRQRALLASGGVVLIGPLGISPLALPVRADAAGKFEVDAFIPNDPALHGATFFLQAVSDSFEDSLEPWLLSNGLRVIVT